MSGKAIEVVARGVDERTILFTSPDTTREATVQLLDIMPVERPSSFRVTFSDGRVMAGACPAHFPYRYAVAFVRGERLR